MMKSHKISRRNFIFVSLAAASTAAFSKPMSFSATGGLTVNVDDYPELSSDGGFKVLKNVTIGDTVDSIIIVRKSDMEFLVFSSVCRHRKCNVKYKKDRNLFVCPCHDSAYDMTGKVVKGPSKQDIPAYHAVLRGRQLEISHSNDKE